MCGVFGAVLPSGDPTEAAQVAALGLFALQHRGQESAGLAVSDGEQLMLYKDLGMIGQVLDERRLPSLRGQLAIAHCRYSTTGSTIWENAQPTFRLGPRRAIAIGHNGNLVNTRDLLAQLPAGEPASRLTDTELLTALLADEPGSTPSTPSPASCPGPRRVQPRRPRRARVIGVRDPHGFRPLVLGRLPRPDRRRPGLWAADDADSGWCLSSETAGLDIVGAEYVRDVEPGEIVVLEPGVAPRSVRFAEATPALRVRAHLLRPARFVHGGPQPVRGATPDGYPARDRASVPSRPRHAGARHGCARGRRLRRALRHPVPRGDRPQPLRGRTFIQPSQAMRQRGVTIKLNPLREVVRGRRLIVVDDSIVRGTTTKQIVGLLRRAGATEVHVRISAPPIYHPCFYGIDTQIETELIASTHSEAEIREFIGADSLGYLSIAGRARALDLPYDRFCFACFDGHYPDPVPYDARAGSSCSRSRSPPWLTDGTARRSTRPPTGPSWPARRRSRPATRRRGAGERAVELMRGHVESTRRPEIARRARRVRPGHSRSRPATGEPILVASTDGVGTKTPSPRRSAARHIGIDLVAMCADDVVCSRRRAARLPRLRRRRAPRPRRRRGARGSASPPAAACRVRARRWRDRRAPGTHGRRRRSISPAAASASSSGRPHRRIGRRGGRPHRRSRRERAPRNGYSLVRSLIAEYAIPLDRPYQEQLRRTLGDAMTDVPWRRAGARARDDRRGPPDADARLRPGDARDARPSGPGTTAGSTSTPSPTSRAAASRQRAADRCPRTSRRGSTPGAGRCRRSCGSSARSEGSRTTSCARRSTAASGWSPSCRRRAVGPTLAAASPPQGVEARRSATSSRRRRPAPSVRRGPSGCRRMTAGGSRSGCQRERLATCGRSTPRRARRARRSDRPGLRGPRLPGARLGRGAGIDTALVPTSGGSTTARAGGGRWRVR
jgi:amidophosphoribosyltransferase